MNVVMPKGHDKAVDRSSMELGVLLTFSISDPKLRDCGILCDTSCGVGFRV